MFLMFTSFSKVKFSTYGIVSTSNDLWGLYNYKTSTTNQKQTTASTILIILGALVGGLDRGSKYSTIEILERASKLETTEASFSAAAET